MARLKHRVAALEVRMGLSDMFMNGIIDVPDGVPPIDCLRDASPGYWLLVDAYDRKPGWLGHVSVNGTKKVMGPT